MTYKLRNFRYISSIPNHSTSDSDKSKILQHSFSFLTYSWKRYNRQVSKTRANKFELLW